MGICRAFNPASRDLYRPPISSRIPIPRAAPDRDRHGQERAFSPSGHGGGVPTGSAKKQLGSGLTDYLLNTILQKAFSKTTLHLKRRDSGFRQHSDGRRRDPGSRHILIGGLSAVRDVSRRLRLGLDVNAPEIHAAGKVDKQLQLTAGGN